MRLHFNRERVEQLLSHTYQATAHQAIYGQKETERPGLNLVGDNGVYLCSNGLPSLRADGNQGSISPETPLMVVYARECDPELMSFEQWWENKRRSFGSDDGIEFLEASKLQAAMQFDSGWLVLEVTPDEILISN